MSMIETMNTTPDGVQRCRFDMFVRLYPETPSHFPKNARIWTHRGDKYTPVESEMICKLIRHIIRKRNLYTLIELYDNSYIKTDWRRIVLKINDQQVERNRLVDYKDMLKSVALPEYLL